MSNILKKLAIMTSILVAIDFVCMGKEKTFSGDNLVGIAVAMAVFGVYLWGYEKFAKKRAGVELKAIYVDDNQPHQNDLH